MQIFGIMVRTKNDPLTSVTHDYAEEILESSRRRGHIFIDLSSETATRGNLIRIIRSIGTPKGNFLKIILFYCHTMGASPVDQNNEEFISDETISCFKGWGVYCIGCNVSSVLARNLLEAGVTFVISFNSTVGFIVGHESEIMRGLNIGILNMLEHGITPTSATDYMRTYFEEEAARIAESVHFWKNPFRISMLYQYAISLQYNGHELLDELKEIQPGIKQAIEYQLHVARFLENLFESHLSQPHLEVINDSGISRYDIVFFNKSQHGFWHDLKVTRGNAIVIFDAKNKNDLVPADADQMLRYSSDWRGNVLFIVCRKPTSEAFKIRASALVKEKNVCILVLSDSDLEEMLLLKDQQNNPIQVIEKRFREIIEHT